MSTLIHDDLIVQGQGPVGGYIAVIGHHCPMGGCLHRNQVHEKEGLQGTPKERNGDSVSKRVDKRFGNCDRDVATVKLLRKKFIGFVGEHPGW